jgi:hypothetical protein
MSEKSQSPLTPQAIAKYVKQNIRTLKKSSMAGMMHGKGDQEIIRQDDYKGHHVVISTKYNITVDGKEVTGHLMLTNAGQVQYHGLPNYSFDSPIALVRALIDNFPEDFQKQTRPSGSPGMKMGGMGQAPSKKTKAKRMKSASARNRRTS